MTQHLLPYRDGAVSVTAGLPAVVGTLVAFLAGVKVGDLLRSRLTGHMEAIAAVPDNVSLTLLRPWPGPTAELDGADGDYEILRGPAWGDVADAALRVAELIRIRPGGTSLSSHEIGLGAKTFLVQSGLPWQPGAPIRASVAGDPSKWMQGIITAYGGTSATLDVQATSGHTTEHASWLFNFAGAVGPAGDDGDDGAAATVAVGAVTTLAAGAAATVENVGLPGAAVFNFGIPRGAAGASPQNFVINPDFQINQRAFGGGAVAAGVYCFDRWKAGAGGCNVSLAGYAVSLASGPLAHVIERAAWGFASLASTQFTVALDAPSIDVNVSLGAASAVITAGAGRRSVTLATGAGDVGNLTLTLSAAAAVTFGRVSVELGAAASPWQARHAAHELAMCQRYFYRHSGAAYTGIAFGFIWNDTLALFDHRHPVTMRATPSLTLSSPATNLALGAPGYSAAPSAFGLWGAALHTPKQARLVATISGAAVLEGKGATLTATATACHFDWSAEL